MRAMRLVVSVIGGHSSKSQISCCSHYKVRTHGRKCSRRARLRFAGLTALHVSVQLAESDSALGKSERAALLHFLGGPEEGVERCARQSRANADAARARAC